MGLGSKTTWMRSWRAVSERGGTEKERGAWAGQGPKEQRTRPWGEQACPACQAASGPPSALYPPPPADQTAQSLVLPEGRRPLPASDPNPRGPAVFVGQAEQTARRVCPHVFASSSAPLLGLTT